jgi:hypothetical protein
MRIMQLEIDLATLVSRASSPSVPVPPLVDVHTRPTPPRAPGAALATSRVPTPESVPSTDLEVFELDITNDDDAEEIVLLEDEATDPGRNKKR